MLFILPLQRLYREKGESMKHNYTLSGELPEMVQAKLNAMNISEVKTRTWRRTDAEFCVTPRYAETPPLLFALRRAPTRNLGRSCAMAATSCVWTPFPSSRPRRPQRSSVM